MRAALVVLLASVVLSAGCGPSGPPVGQVKGQVTWNGQPLKYALIRFQPLADGRPSSSFTDDQGNYELSYTRDRRGALIGEHTVEIYAEEELREDASGQGRVQKILPDEYHGGDSVLKATVNSGENVINWTLPIN
jgi:hypothetical protein